MKYHQLDQMRRDVEEEGRRRRRGKKEEEEEEKNRVSEVDTVTSYHIS